MKKLSTVAALAAILGAGALPLQSVLGGVRGVVEAPGAVGAMPGAICSAISI